MTMRMMNLLAVCLLASGCSAVESGASTLLGSVDEVGAQASQKITDEAADAAADDGHDALADRGTDGPKGRSGAPAARTAAGDVPVLNVYYVIHGHQQGEHLPYADASMDRLDRAKAENFLDSIKNISETTNKYGMPVTWELVAGTAKGIRELQGADNIFKKLIAQGHEVGIHTHDASRIRSTTEMVNQSLGILVTTGSGLQMEAINAGPGGANRAMSEGIAEMVKLGIDTASIGLVNSTRSPLEDVCRRNFGEGNDMSDRTGMLLFPYKPDYKNNNICAHDPDGDFVFVDHLGPAWLMAGRKGQLADQNFEVLKKSLDTSLAYMAENKPSRVAAWGFTSHLSEYCQGSQGGPVIGSSVDSLDQFMQYLAEKEREGRIRFVTVGEIGDQL